MLAELTEEKTKYLDVELLGFRRELFVTFHSTRSLFIIGVLFAGITIGNNEKISISDAERFHGKIPEGCSAFPTAGSATKERNDRLSRGATRSRQRERRSYRIGY